MSAATTAMAVREPILRPLLLGHQTIHGLWFPADWFAEHDRAVRILQAWYAGATVLRFDDGDLLRYARAVEVDCATVTGWPLHRLDTSGALTSACLSLAERARLPLADLHLVHGALVVSRQTRNACSLDPADWLSTDAYVLHDTYDERIAADELVQLAPEPASDVRAIFGDRIPAASGERGALLQAMSAAVSGSSGRPGNFAFGSVSGKGVLIGVAAAVWVLIVLALLIRHYSLSPRLPSPDHVADNREIGNDASTDRSVGSTHIDSPHAGTDGSQPAAADSLLTGGNGGADTRHSKETIRQHDSPKALQRDSRAGATGADAAGNGATGGEAPTAPMVDQPNVNGSGGVANSPARVPVSPPANPDAPSISAGIALSIMLVVSLVLMAVATWARHRKRTARPTAGPVPAAPRQSVLDRIVGGSRIRYRIWLGLSAAGLVGLAMMAGSNEWPAIPPGLIGILVGLMVLGLRGKDRESITAGRSAPAAKPPAIPQRRQPPSPSRWRRWMQQLSITSNLSKVLGRRQAAYMRRILEMFETGNLDEALRHAIPIDSKQANLGPAFGTPQARGSLALSQASRSAYGIAMGDDLQAHLRSLYRQSFGKLDRENRVDEAVFVLAELLQARQEALDYLERKQRYAEAAELALMWDMAPDVIVRLQCLAGNWRVAVAVARRDAAFANTVLQLQTKFPDVARRLRLEWTQALVTQGDWLGAVDAIWPLEGERHQAIDWIAKAEAAGGRLGARALVQRARLLPDTLEDGGAQLTALRDDPQCADERGAIAAALLATSERGNNKATNRLTRVIMGAVLADQSAALGTLGPRDLQRLLSANGDAALYADLPPGGLPSPLMQDLSAGNGVREWSTPESGGLHMFDAAALDDGDTLLALGESGAVVIDSDGRIRRRFAVPAQRIVIATTRQVALVLARRDRLWRVSRLDLVTRQIVDLGMMELQHFADTFDGIAWTLARERSIRVLDTQSSLTSALWQYNDLPGNVHAFSANAALDQFLVAIENRGFELWRYRLPQRRLISRDEWKPMGTEESSQVLLPTGGVLEIWGHGSAGDSGVPEVTLYLRDRAFTIALPEQSRSAENSAPASRLRLVPGDSWVVFSDELIPGRWYVLSLQTQRIHAMVNWPADAMVRIRACGNEWLMFDDQGRLLRFDTTTSSFKGVSPH